MRRCLQIAENGLIDSMPNPCVGAVIVHNNKIIGEGYTSKFGGAHGEINAINAVEDKALLPESTLYVMLEPCSHYGKTPPCSDLIVQHQIQHVVIGTTDPHPLVAGKGIQRLQQSGIQTTIGILEKECKWSMRKFLLPIKKQRPYITLKWAQSSNNKISQANGQPVAITSSSTQILTHQLRAQHQGILCGWKTIFHDHPKLNNRLWEGPSPQVFILDPQQNLNQNEYFLTQHQWKRIVNHESKRKNDIVVANYMLKNILSILFQEGLQSLFVEGGAYTLQQFINEKLWDECYVYQGENNISNGKDAPILSHQKLLDSFYLEKDYIRHFISNQ
ncbi:MAG: bifunctional diaminohydroxyphosphoribosylaminopyrimidine deaminase/5-amino-6-(5-phosphoribosylamino)uracil reductase RibD [Chitinophagales bacterium]|nr:bifunctional diaminohydroxyphosphoribosylaminopyrimidine deaminase/5-amino-6-(5-phosphoribosylamino)uracil reductase RibD [Chitinophagales bacterium]